MGGGRQSKKGDSAALRRSLFRAGFIPGWLLQPGGFGPNPVGWRWRVSHSWGWMCCWQFCRRGESSKTHAGVLVLGLPGRSLGTVPALGAQGWLSSWTVVLWGFAQSFCGLQGGLHPWIQLEVSCHLLRPPSNPGASLPGSSWPGMQAA